MSKLVECVKLTEGDSTVLGVVLEQAREGYLYVANNGHDGYYILAKEDITIDDELLADMVEEGIYDFLLEDGTRVSIKEVY